MLTPDWKNLKRENDLLTVKPLVEVHEQKQVHLTVEENEQYLQEVEFLKKTKEEEKNRFSVGFSPL